MKLSKCQGLKRILSILSLLLVTSLLIVMIYHYDVLCRSISRGNSYTHEEANRCVGTTENIESTSEFSEVETVILKVRDSVLSLKRKFNIPGISICVAVNDSIVWNEHIGCVDLENNIPVGEKTLFRIGSISKSMTAIGLFKLYEQGRLDLNKPLRNYLPEFPEKDFEIPIRCLASHQSGIRHYRGVEMLSNKEYASLQESLAPFENSDLLFEPGTNYQYSTYNYVVLGRVIEKITSSNYLEFMQDEVFKPLQMTSTSPETVSQKIIGYSSGKNASKIKNAIQVNVSNKYPGGGFLSTSKDLVHMMMHLDTLINKETQSKLFEVQTLKNGEETQSEYAFGFRNTYLSKSKLSLIHHGGSSIGGRAFLLKVVEPNVIVAICANSDTGVLKTNNYDLQEVYDIAKLFIDKND